MRWDLHKLIKKKDMVYDFFSFCDISDMYQKGLREKQI